MLTLLLSSSSCRCTLDELWDLAVKYVLPTIPAGDDGDRGGLKTVLFRELLERPDVSFESDAGRSALEAALQGVDPLAESGGAGGARVRCKQSRIDIALTNGQVTLLNLLSETDMKTLKFVGKARFEGLLQKNFKVTGNPQTMAYATILRLCDYGLLVRRDVVTPLRDDKGRDGSPAVQNTKCVYLPCFVPPEDELAGLTAGKVAPVFSASAKGKECERRVIKHLEEAAGNVLRANELRKVLKLTKPQWNNTVQSLAKRNLVEKCSYQEGEKRSVDCVKLKKEGGQEACGSERAGKEAAPRAEIVGGSHVFAESYPMMNILHLLEQSAPGGADGVTIETRCWLHSKYKYLKEHYLKELQDANLVKKEKYNIGREVGWNFMLAGEAVANAENQVAENDEFTPQNRMRQSFILDLLKEKKFVLLSRLREMYCEVVGSAETDKGIQDLFKDNKSTQRSIAVLIDMGICRLETVHLSRKTVVASHTAKILVKKDVKVDKSLLMEIEKEQVKKPYRERVSKVEVQEVNSISHLIPGTSGQAMMKEEGVVKREDGDVGVLPKTRNSSNTVFHMLRLNGYIAGDIARVMTLHKYLWAMLTEKGSSSLNLDACLSGFSLSNFLRLVGIVSVPEEFLEADYNSETKICELPTSYQELFVNKKAENRFTAMIRVLKSFGLAEEYHDLDGPETSEADPRGRKARHITLKKYAHMTFDEKNPFLESEYGTAIVERIPVEKLEKVTFKLDSGESRDLYWDCLQSTFEGSGAGMHEQKLHLFPASVNRDVCFTKKWRESSLSSFSLLTFRMRQEILEELNTTNPKAQVDVDLGKLATKHGVGETILSEFVYYWVKNFRTSKIKSAKRLGRGDPVKNKSRRYTEKEDEILATAFAIARVTQGGDDSKEILWKDLPGVPSYLWPSLSTRLSKLRSNESVRAQFEEFSNFCAKNEFERREGGEGEDEDATLERYPQTLRMLANQDKDLRAFLLTLGDTFALEWNRRLEELKAVVKRESAAMLKAKVVKKKKKKGSKRIRMKQIPPMEGTSRKKRQKKGKSVAKSRSNAVKVEFPELEALQVANFLGITYHQFLSEGKPALHLPGLVQSYAPRQQVTQEGRLLSFLFRSPGAREDSVVKHLGEQGAAEELLSACVERGSVRQVSSSAGTRHYFLAC